MKALWAALVFTLAPLVVMAAERGRRPETQSCARVSLAFMVVMFIALAFITRQATRSRPRV